MAANSEDLPHPVDIYVGSQLRLFRTQRGWNQGELAEQAGISFQAIQKYETGSIRISASRLYELAKILGVSPGNFFDGYTNSVVVSQPDSETRPETDLIDRREVMTLVRAYYGIRDKELQHDVLRLITRLGSRDADSNASTNDG